MFKIGIAFCLFGIGIVVVSNIYELSEAGKVLAMLSVTTGGMLSIIGSIAELFKD